MSGMKAAHIAAPPERFTAPHERATAPQAGAALLFLREEQMRLAQDLFFFAQRDLTASADIILAELGLGKAHHRALHFIGRNPSMTVGDLLSILRITKQSLARVLNELIRLGYVVHTTGRQDRRCCRSPPKVRRWNSGCSRRSGNAWQRHSGKREARRSKASAGSCARSWAPRPAPTWIAAPAVELTGHCTGARAGGRR